jgi:nitroreductase
VQAGIDAPTGCNAQSVSFVIADEPSIIQEIAKINGDRTNTVCRTAQAVIALVCDKTPVYGHQSFYLEDCAAAAQNIFLALTALGYASVWIEGGILGEGSVQIGKILGVPKEKEVRILMPVGVPEKPGTPNPKKPFEQRAWFNKYGG